jgi:hypothetical protein
MMWDGAFSPDLTKGKLTDKDVTFDPTNTDNLDGDPESIEGRLSVRLTGKWYAWENITYQQYLDFQASGFSRSWMNKNLPIDYAGDWGWPYGRGGSKKPGFFTI